MVLKTCIVDHYRPQYRCITIDELQTLLRLCKRHSPAYTFYLLRATTGMRNAETLWLSLTELYNGGTVIKYQIVKPKTEVLKEEQYIHRKHREIVLDSWVAEELRTYLNNNFALTVDGKTIYASPYHGLDPNTGNYKQQLLFPWKNSQVIACNWSRLKKKMAHLGFSVDRLEKKYYRPYKEQTEITFVFRSHMLRHLYCSITYIKNGGDIKGVQEDIGHTKLETTQKYIHSPRELNTTTNILLNSSWAEICGYEEEQTSIPQYKLPTQTSIRDY